jgi:hypothetical protein
MKKILLSALFATFILFASASGDNTGEAKNADANVATISLSGDVFDIHTGEPLTGVEVSIEGTDLKAYSDFDGHFTIQNVKPGAYNLIASFISYKKSLVENYELAANKELNIKLQAD